MLIHKKQLFNLEKDQNHYYSFLDYQCHTQRFYLNKAPVLLLF